MLSGGCVLDRTGLLPADEDSCFSVPARPFSLIFAGMGGTGGRSTSRGTLMLSFRPGEKLYVRRFSNFFDSRDDFRFPRLSLRLLLLSGPEVISDPLPLPSR